MNKRWHHRFDFVIARALLQHLPSLPEFLASVSRVLKPGGVLLLIDAKDSLLKWTPRVSAIEELMARLAKTENSNGAGRDAMKKVERICKQFPFEILRRADLVYSSSNIQTKKAIFSMFSNLGDLCNAHFGLSIDLNRYRQGLASWRKAPDSYAQFGMTSLVLKRHA